MQKNFSLSLLVVFHFLTFLSSAEDDKWLLYKKGDFLFDFSVNYKIENFYVKNGQYLSGNPMDQVLYVQGTWDFNTHTRFGNRINSKLTLRSKARWGNTRSILTTQESLSIVDFSVNEHSHSLNRIIPWFRKAWVKASLNEAFDIKTDRRHSLKIGIFPYELGRGISLGSAYAVTPGPLGFFTDNSIDQYAFGALLRGDLSKENRVTYDFYCAVLENLSGSFAQTTEVVNRKCLNCPSIYRGFGDINTLFASRLNATFFDNNAFGKLTFEPYVLYNWIPAQKVEIYSDANVKLGTFGAAIEYTHSKYEFGVETAFNFGRQFVKGWDRNSIIPHRNATTAAIEEIYDNVYTDSTYTTNALVTDAYKTIVDNAPKGVCFNGEQIGTSTLYNGPYRFRPSYSNLFGGNMMVADATYWFKPKVLCASLAFGYASGDEHPNIILDEPTDTERTDTYGGFIGLQEIYSGKRVRSIFVIGGQQISRPLSAPELRIMRRRQLYAVNVSGFSNLIYSGAGIRWTPDKYKRKVMLNSNALYYWQDFPAKKYCLATYGSQQSCSSYENANRALGLEVNLFLEVNWLDNFKGFLATAVFVPGQHFNEVIGKPTNARQYAEVSRNNGGGDTRYCIDYNQYPLLNNKTAFVWDIGFEYNF